MNGKKNILFIANPFWDHIVAVDRHFLDSHDLQDDSSLFEFDPHQFQLLRRDALQFQKNASAFCDRIGGSATTVMTSCAYWGHQCSQIGKIGSDDVGNAIKQQLKTLNVHSLLITVPKENTGTVLCFQNEGKRTMVIGLGATQTFCAHDLDFKQLQGFEHYHMDGYTAFYDGVVAKSLAIAKDSHATTSLNLPTADFVQEHCKVFLATLPQVDYIFGNYKEFFALTGHTSIEKTLNAFDRQQLVCATGGGQGSWVKAAGSQQITHYPVKAVEAKNITNRTGAGDVWTGIFLSLFLGGSNIDLCVEKANQGAGEWIQMPLNQDQRHVKLWENLQHQGYS